jgi:hypothetical protein
MVLAEEVADVLVGVYTADELTKRVAEVGRLYAETLASPPAGLGPGLVAPR